MRGTRGGTGGPGDSAVRRGGVCESQETLGGGEGTGRKGR